MHIIQSKSFQGKKNMHKKIPNGKSKVEDLFLHGSTYLYAVGKLENGQSSIHFKKDW